MTNIMVPGRKVYISPGGNITLGFNCVWLWDYPEAINALQARQVWDGILEGQYLWIDIGKDMVDKLYEAKAEYYGFKWMDLGFASRGQDIWIVQAKGILDISERMNNLLLALRTMVNRNRLELMVVTTWEIIEALGIMGHPFVDPFWDTFAYLWKARFSSNPPTFASDFGLGDINLSMKLQKVINAKG